jgi:hypothetical protein
MITLQDAINQINEVFDMKTSYIINLIIDNITVTGLTQEDIVALLTLGFSNTPNRPAFQGERHLPPEYLPLINNIRAVFEELNQHIIFFNRERDALLSMAISAVKDTSDENEQYNTLERLIEFSRSEIQASRARDSLTSSISSNNSGSTYETDTDYDPFWEPPSLEIAGGSHLNDA